MHVLQCTHSREWQIPSQGGSKNTVSVDSLSIYLWKEVVTESSESFVLSLLMEVPIEFLKAGKSGVWAVGSKVVAGWVLLLLVECKFWDDGLKK